jgi:hypothetical protein
MTSPGYLKILLAPFLDFYFIKSIGKNKTWIVLFSIVLIFLSLTIGLRIDDYIESKNVYMVLSYGFLMGLAIMA